MLALFIPTLAKVVDIARSVVFGDVGGILELKKAISSAHEFMHVFRNAFYSYISSLQSNEELSEVIGFIEKDMKSVSFALKDLSSVLERERFVEMNPVVYSLEKHSSNLYSSVLKFNDILYEVPESPIPVINHVIKTGYNVAEGKVEPRELAGLLPPLAAFTAYLGAEIERFELLHSDYESLLKSLKKLLADLEDGVGAIFLFLKDGIPVNLIDGLRILKFASPPIYINLRKMDEIVLSESEYSKIPALNEYCRIYTLYNDGKGGLDSLKLALINLKKLQVLYNETMVSIKLFPYFPFIEEEYRQAELSLKGFNDFFDDFVDKTEKIYDKIDLKILVEKFEKGDEVLNNIVRLVENEIRKVSGAPLIEELKELIGRFLSGVLVVEYFANRLEMFAGNQKRLLDEFRRKSAGSDLAGEVCQLLDMQKEGIDEMMLFLEDSDKTHLLKGMKLLEEPLPRLLQIRKGVAPVKKSQKLLCPFCNAQFNEGDRECSECGKPLPLILGESLPEDEEPLPSKIEAIVRLAPDVISGMTSPDKMLAETSKYKVVLSQVRKELDSKMKRISSSSRSEIRDGAVTFNEELTLLESAIEELIYDLENGNDISGSISKVRFAGHALDELRGILKETKRVLKKM